MDRKQYLDASDIGDIFCVRTKQMIRWAKEGKIPHLKLPSGKYRFNIDDVTKALKS